MKQPKFFNVNDYRSVKEPIRIITGTRIGGKTTGYKLYCLNHTQPHNSIALVRRAGDRTDYLRTWLSDLQFRASQYKKKHPNDTKATILEALNWTDMMLEDGKAAEKTKQNLKIGELFDTLTLTYLPDPTITIQIYFILLYHTYRLRRTEFAGATDIFFDDFCTGNQFLTNEPTLLLDLWATLSRDDEPLKIWLLGNADNDGTPYNLKWDFSFVDHKLHRYPIYVHRVECENYQSANDTPVGKAIMALDYRAGAYNEGCFVVPDYTPAEQISSEFLQFIFNDYVFAICTMRDSDELCVKCLNPDELAYFQAPSESPALYNLSNPVEFEQFRTILRRYTGKVNYADRYAYRLWLRLLTFIWNGTTPS